MGKALLTTMLIFMLAQAMGQRLVKAPALPLSGDTIFFLTDELPRRIDVGNPGPGQRWNFTSLQAPYIQHYRVESAMVGRSQERFPSADIVLIDDTGFESYLRQDQSCITYLGGRHANRTKRHDKGIPTLPATMRYGDSVNYEDEVTEMLSYDQLPDAWRTQWLSAISDSIQIRSQLRQQINMDAWGSLQLPGHQHEVLRLHVLEETRSTYLARRGRGDWEDVTHLAPPELVQQSHQVYRFVRMDDAALVASVETDAMSRAQKVTYMVPATQARYYKTSVPGQWLYAYPNPAFSFVRFKFDDIIPGKYNIRFYNILGKQLLQRTYDLDRQQTIEVNIGHLDKGTYLYSLEDTSGKKIVTKRLIVLKP